MNSTIASVISNIGSLEQTFAHSQDLYQPEKGAYYADLLYKTIQQRFALDTIKILSFDVFDTLLLRNSKYEPYRYLEMSARVKEFLMAKDIRDIPLEEIYGARLTAFHVCYRTVSQNCRVKEGRLIDVLSLMAKILNLDRWVIPELIKIELAYETENLRVNSVLQAFLKIPEIQNKPVIFISDMYMSGEHIYQLVNQAYPNLKLAKYYSSADYSLTKLSGFLYNFVARDLKLDCSQILHLGDNLKGDVQQAKVQGLKAIHLPIPDFYLQERQQEKEKFQAEMKAKNFVITR